eukprot:scaffold47312_cov30-Tisochrysis_lutea.AAC.3
MGSSCSLYRKLISARLRDSSNTHSAGGAACNMLRYAKMSGMISPTLWSPSSVRAIYTVDKHGGCESRLVSHSAHNIRPNNEQWLTCPHYRWWHKGCELRTCSSKSEKSEAEADSPAHSESAQPLFFSRERSDPSDSCPSRWEIYRCGLDFQSPLMEGIGHNTVSRRNWRTGTLTRAWRIACTYGSPPHADFGRSIFGMGANSGSTSASSSSRPCRPSTHSRIAFAE